MKTVFNIIGPMLLILAPGEALANPRPLPFTYPYETLPEGSLEVELYTDVTPLRVQLDPAAPAAGRIWEPRYAIENEIEYGINDRWELGFYQVFEANPRDGGDNGMTFDGLKFRLRTRIAEAGELPVDIGLYFELETMHDEISLEGKVDLARRFGRLRWMANLWVEESFGRPYDTSAHGQSAAFIVNPTMGLTYQFAPAFSLGAEYWARGQLRASGPDDQARENSRVHHFLGPAVHLDFGKLWWSFGLYANLNTMKTPEPGDLYGPVWARSVIGLEL